jgi:hypothetical protein
MSMSEAAESEAWERYGRAIITAMRDVLDEADDRHAELLLEAADFWLAIGLALGLERADKAEALLAIIERPGDEHHEPLSDADEFLAEALP